MNKGWYFQPYRHSLAAKGVSTSFVAPRSSFRGKDIRELQKEYLKPFEVGSKLNKFEIKPIERGKRKISKKAEVEEEIQWIENVLADEEIELAPERRKELGESLANLLEKNRHIPGRPPLGYVVDKDIPIGEYGYYKGTSGRVPDFVREITRHADLRKPEIERQVAYEERKQIMADMRAEERVLDAIDAKIMSLEPDKLEESDILDPDVLVKRRTDINFALKKDFPGENPRETANFYRYRQKDPKRYDAFRVKELPSGKKIVFGRKKSTAKDYHKERKWEVQSILVPKGG